jgi:hypothetical protein
MKTGKSDKRILLNWAGGFVFRRTALIGVVVIGLAGQAFAQVQTRERGYDADFYGPLKGDWELTLGGSASNDKDFENGGFSLDASIGYFLTDAIEVALRQGFNFSDFSGDSSWNGSTRGAIDYHFNLDRFRPFVGANFGGFYGDGVTDTFAAGLEGGAKFYVKPKTFIFAMIEYQWLFNDGDDVDDNFDDGRFLYSLGIGFNF